MSVAVVTGGTGALGRAVVNAFSQSGYEVYLTTIDESERAGYQGPGKVDVVNLASLEEAKRWVAGINKPISAAALVAGGFTMQPIEKASEEDFEHLMNLNARSAFYSLSVLVPYLERAGSSSVVMVGARVYSGAASMALYAGSKAFVVSLAKSASIELKAKGIRVNVILPDIIDTPANRRVMPDADFEKWAKPEEIAQVILYLCSEESRLITGAAIPVGR
ncbi:MAG TPA: SDR family oxidoreductase [Fimbriimonadales bacterium]|nr:SDR family oxidoreductase [Fimbriimonadales bacterium]